MDQEEFDQLLKRYMADDVSEAERALVDNWYQAIGHTSSGASAKEKEEIRLRLKVALTALKKNTTARRDYHPGHDRTVMPWPTAVWAIAASIVLILGIAGILMLTAPSISEYEIADGHKAHKNSDPWERIENTATNAYLINLSDGTEIELEPGALIEYPKVFASDKREIRLIKGSVFFHVKRDERHPFYVYSFDLVTRVLGTSFTVNSNQQGQVTVDVKTGSVSVSALPSKAVLAGTEIILTPNQRASYNPQDNKLVRTLVEKPRVVIPSQEVKNMVFQEASIADIFAAVEKAYHVKILFDKEKFSACVLTTYLIPEEDLYTRLKIICGAIGATYHVEDGNIIVKGNGC